MTRVRDRDGWRALERGTRGGAPGEDDLRERAVVVLDAIEPAAVSTEFDRALASFVRNGGGLLVLGGAPPGIDAHEAGGIGARPGLCVRFGHRAGGPTNPLPTPEGRELLQWDDDAARGERAWRAARPARRSRAGACRPPATGC